ncbi:MAG: ABC transporter permease [Sedimentisphaerales bacterium]|nr:ABC transporter permease [Sedimentisphaerales bacterium]
MSLRDFHMRHLRLVSAYWTRYAVRGGAGLVYLLLALFFGLMVAHLTLSPLEQKIRELSKTHGADEKQIVNELVETARPIVQWILDSKPQEDPAKPAPESYPTAGGGPMGPFTTSTPDAWTRYLLNERPALLSGIFLILLFGMPFIISVLGFNQTAGDIQSRGLRYLMLRTDRSNIYFGRFLGSVIFSTLVTAFLVATITLYVGLKFRIYSTGALTVWALIGFGAISILMLPYLAVCTAISASVSSPFLALAAAKLVIVGVPVAALVGKHSWEPIKNIKYLLPWGIQNYLLHPEWTHYLGAAAGCLGYTLVFLLLGYAWFQRRDL